MNQNNQKNLGYAIFDGIEHNDYLNELYDRLLVSYGLVTLGKDPDEFGDQQLRDVLRFADLLSKSNHPTRREHHQVWSQEIAVLCLELFPDNPIVSPYLASIFQAVSNYQALAKLEMQQLPDVFEQAFEAFQEDYLQVPGSEDLHFFAPQKRAFDAFDKKAFSYSAPTSLGKSFLMRTFIKRQILEGHKENFVVLVPTKALINEVRSRFINELGDELANKNYRVVSAAGDIVLEGDHNFIFVLTPERLLYLLITKPLIPLDFVFVDEAHKLSGKNKRAPFYYQVCTMLLQRPNPPAFIFAAPNIPNPETFLSLLQSEAQPDSAMVTRFSPVAQFKFFVDLGTDRSVSAYNHRTNETSHLATSPSTMVTLTDFLLGLRQVTQAKNRQQTIVYHASKQAAVDNARELATNLPVLQDADLHSLANDVRREVHDSYFLADLVQKGVAYHIGHLPASVRLRVEELFRAGKIHTLFCTSTLLEGVNLPADNLVITSHRNGRRNLKEIDFNNLVGRVGRIEFNLFGNVFFVTGTKTSSQEKYETLLKTEVPEQRLAVDTHPESLPETTKRNIVAALKEGRMPRLDELGKGEQAEMARKFAVVLLRDITADRTSAVRVAFADFLTDETSATIQAKFQETFNEGQDDDINVSVDQQETLSSAVRAGLRFPPINPSTGTPDYDATVRFLEKLALVFKWKDYEPQTIGFTSGKHLTKLRWYAVILMQWIGGKGLRTILTNSIHYQSQHPENFWYDHKKTRYTGSLEHKNSVCNDALNAIENVVLFSLANYFLRVSKEIKRQEGKEELENDWYEFVEYGTTLQDTIVLQRMGFTRESASWIREHVPNFSFQTTGDERRYLNPDLLEVDNASVQREAKEIKYNIPEAFSMPPFLF